MRKNCCRFIALIIFCFPVLAMAAGKLHLFTVHHRPAAQVAQTLRPLAGPDGVVRASGDQLIVKADPEAMANIRKALRRLDVPAKQLLISVRQTADDQKQHDGYGVSGHATGRHGGVVVQPRSGGDAGAVLRDKHGNVIRGRVTDHDHHHARDVSQRIHVLSGQTAVIHVGQRVPVEQRYIAPSTRGPVIVNGQRLADVSTGYRVTPRVHGQRFTMQVAPQMEHLRGNGKQISVRGMHTTISGRLGEWVSLGGSNTRISGTHSGLAHRDSVRGQSLYGVQVKVEVQQ